MITSENQNTPELEAAGFTWRGRDGVLVLSNTGLTDAGFTNGFSTRLGGVSTFPNEALNLAGYNEDTADNIAENRRRFLTLFDGEWSLATVWQIHSADVSTITGPTDPVAELDRCDALIGNLPGILAAVKTADCVPVLLGDPRTGAYAAIHAGWRGTLDQIVAMTVNQLQDEYGVDPFDLQAAIGPAAGRCCYEVGDEVITAFRDRFAHAANLFEPTRDGHARIDLHQANFNQLIAAGVSAEKIQVAPLCTIDRNDLFFSYRKEKKLHGKTGRLLSVIGRKP